MMNAFWHKNKKRPSDPGLSHGTLFGPTSPKLGLSFLQVPMDLGSVAPDRVSSSFLVQRCRFSVKEVVHHYDVLSVVIRPRRRIAGNDLHSSNTSIAKDNADEGQVSVARRSRRGAPEKQLAAGAEVLDQSAGVTVFCSVSWSAAIWGVNVGKNHAKSSRSRWRVAVACLEPRTRPR